MVKVYVIPKDDSKKEKAKAWLQNRWTDAKCFWAENKHTIEILTPVVIGGMTVMVKAISRHNKLTQEKSLKELFVWDPKLGLYYQLRKAMTNSQRLELERRKEAGESIGQILASMKLLK
jgi:putative protein kinase ArgK-like GTPase of G3E family